MVRLRERREHERHQLFLPVLLELEGGEKMISEESRIINISVGGAYLPMGSSVDVGQPVSLNIKTDILDSVGLKPLAGEATIRVNAKVVRATNDPEYPGGPCVGVRFKGPFRILGAAPGGAEGKAGAH